MSSAFACSAVDRRDQLARLEQPPVSRRRLPAQKRHRRLDLQRLGDQLVLLRRRPGRSQGKALRGEVGALVEIARSGRGLGRQRQPPGLGDRVGAELRRALVPGQGAGVAAALADLAGRALEGGGDLLVGAVRRRRQLPGAPVGLRGSVQGRGQRLVDRAPLRQRRRVMDGRPDQRVAEGQGAAVDLDQARRAGRVEVGQRGAERARRSQDRGEVAGALGRRDQQHGPGGFGEAGELALERGPETVGQRQRALRLRACQHPGKLKQGERVPGRLGQHPVPAAGGQAVGQQLGRGLGGQAVQGQLGQPGSRRSAPVLAHTSSTIDSLSSRRAANSRASALARSSHCASSTTHSSGCSAASSASSDRTASPTRNRSGGPALASPRAPRSASAWTPGSASTRSRAGRSSRCSPAKGSSDSSSIPAPRMTRKPSARRDHVAYQSGLADAGVAAQHQCAAGPLAGPVEQVAEGRQLGVPAVQLHVSYATRSWPQELPIRD